MNKIFFKFSLFVSLIVVYALQTSAQVTNWVVVEQGMGVSVCTDLFNNTYTCGQFVDNTTIGTYNFTSLGSQDIVVEKYDPFGNLLWATPFGGSQSDFSSKIINDGYGNVWVTGQFSGTVLAGAFTLVSAGGTDAFIVKLNASDGTIVYAQRCGGAGNDAGMAIKEDPFGDIYLAGNFVGSFNFGGVTLSGQGSNDVFLVKMDNAGTPQSGFTIRGSAIEAMWTMTTDANSNIYIGGFTTSSAVIFANTTVNFTSQSQFIAKFDALGNYVWSTSAQFNGEVYGLSADAYGNVYFTGNFDTQATIGSFTLTGVGNDDILLAKINSSGTFVWAHSYGGTAIDEGYDMKCTPSGDLFLTGSFQGAFTFGATNLNAGSFSKTYVAKIDSAGNVNWVIQSGGAASSHISNGIAINSGGEIYLTGSGNGVFKMGIHSDSVSGSYLVKVDDHANIILGTVFRDMNNDGVINSGENGMPNVILELDNSPYVVASNNAGIYQMFTASGSHSVSISNLPLYHTLTTVSVQTASFSGMGNMDTANNFGLYPIPNVNDLRIDITPVTSPKAGHVLSYLITYTNVGTTTLNGTVTLQSDPAISYLNAAPSPTMQSGQTTTWNVGTLLPQSMGTIYAQFNIPSGQSIGYPINAILNISPVVNDTTPSDNSRNIVNAVTGPYDPNYKEVNIDTLYDVMNPDWLEYTIHFQNIGNDTAVAVIIIDTLSQHLNLSSFEMISSTHPISNFNIVNGNVAEFRFYNIMLPDSATDQPGSNGFVKYRVKYRNTLALNQSIINYADIYFDYNPAVRTNSAITYYLDSSADIMKYDKQKTLIYPNPAKDRIVIESSESIMNTVLSVYNIQGFKILKKNIVNMRTELDIRDLSSGIYFIIIEYEEGIVSKKFVKE